MAELPYFDLLIDERQDGGETGQLWENQVHWGYWEDPKTAKGTRDDYIAAMEQMDHVLFAAGKVADGQKLLDAGCGFGGTIQQVNGTYSDMDLTGLNIDPRQLAAAEAQTKPVNGNKIGWVEADACQLPFEDNSFDRVLAVECIFHFPSREKFLAEAARVLKPGGYLAVSDFVPTLMFFGKTPIWMAIRPRIAKSYGTLGNVPLRGYRSMGKRAGLELAEKRNIRKNTLPTYPFLLKFFREQGSADAQKTMIVGTRWMKWLSKAGLIQYRVYTFQKPA
ncbi:SAM-dependent methyltransferase [Mycolicibacterium peregrinum]|uniref:SAM-dependent methyltransferase n=1 Tax=Mycolicibacterium peregrinum TaxID=43304 RepID=A0A1X2AMQ2_MYCPR|nr:class I SAM-dependent methyltransferase [Mycolicibacterium peregrinum]MCV7204044.1 methyltransferase domain-containing protein [Mycolicibacterium peregrinum]ORW52625.1 methyltransferase type 11 [Mycolicibacterium peregrinum]OWM04341.1 SAM-dependent methyltransferase [Mycolicibacterium peregrinum]TGB39664.1 SAM-dependent methyltransferase [Mycolicibacterium peregrinum]TGB40037.1 SAM-dependent methyltransferase [Mycolicibacterium peregrinum]